MFACVYLFIYYKIISIYGKGQKTQKPFKVSESGPFPLIRSFKALDLVLWFYFSQYNPIQNFKIKMITNR